MLNREVKNKLISCDKNKNFDNDKKNWNREGGGASLSFFGTITVNDAIVFYFLSKNKNVKKCASGGW